MNLLIYLYWHFKNKNNVTITTCPMQYYPRKSLELYCDRDNKICYTPDINNCTYIPKLYLKLIFMFYFFTGFIWTQIRESVTRKRAVTNF